MYGKFQCGRRLGGGEQGKEEAEALRKESRATARCRDRRQDSGAGWSPPPCLSSSISVYVRRSMERQTTLFTVDTAGVRRGMELT